MLTFVIVPACNEGKVITAVLSELKKYPYHIIVVDDGSEDGTGDIAEGVEGVVVVRHFINRGQGAALQTGIEYALREGAEAIVTFDADGQHCASQIEGLLQPLRERRAEAVLGSRFLHPASHAMPFKKVVIRKLALLHQWFFSGLSVTDNHCGLRAFSRKAAERITITQDRMSHASEILNRIREERLSYIEVPVEVRDTAYSLKKGQKSILGSIRILYDFFMGRIVR